MAIESGARRSCSGLLWAVAEAGWIGAWVAVSVMVSFPLEDGCAFLGEGIDAFLPVLRRADERHALELGGQAGVQRALGRQVHLLLGELHRERRLARHLQRERTRRVEEALVREHPVGQADAHRLLALDALAQE